MLIVQNQMPLHAIVRSWTLLATLRVAHELLIIIMQIKLRYIYKLNYTYIIIIYSEVQLSATRIWNYISES